MLYTVSPALKYSQTGLGCGGWQHGDVRLVEVNAVGLARLDEDAELVVLLEVRPTPTTQKIEYGKIVSDTKTCLKRYWCHCKCP